MKSGTGDDPFAEEEPDDQEDDTRESDAEEASAGSSPGAAESTTGGAAPPGSGPGADANGSSGQPVESADIPWVLRRSSVKDDRPNMTQFFLQESTDHAEREFQREVEDILGKDVYLLDLREAAYQVAMAHPDEVAAVLREWGYDYL